MLQPLINDFPLRVYIYNPDGTYGEPININSDTQLNGPGTRMMLQIAMKQKVEIRITNLLDELVFHAKDGRIYFDGEKEYPKGREVQL